MEPKQSTGWPQKIITTLKIRASVIIEHITLEYG